MSESTGKAVFISYASQDAEAVSRIAEALRARGVEVWFDKDELVGGDQWDAKIRRQIAECALFVPVISAATQARLEGHFRVEWKLAAQRTHAMAEEKTFLLPVVIDDTRDAEAKVPGEFKAVQWTQIGSADSLTAFGERVQVLLRGPVVSPFVDRAPGPRPVPQPSRAPKRGWLVPAVIGAVVLGVAAIVLLRPRRSPEEIAQLIESMKNGGAKATAAKPATPPAGSPSAGLSPARQLAEKARVLLDGIDSTPDDYATAEGLVKRALELEQNDGEIWAISSRLNSMYMSRAFDTTDARREPARSQAERALKLAPDSVEVLLAVARANRRGDPTRAEAALRQALTLAPKDGRLLLNLGSLYRVQNRPDEAMALYEQAAASPDVMPLARYDQYLISFYQRNFAEAERYVREAAAALPSVNFVTGHAMLELTWRGQPEAALRVLAVAPGTLRNEPRFVITNVLAAEMNRQPEQALAALRQFPADYINDAWYAGPKALLVGLCQLQANRPEAARVAWESGIALLRKRLQDAPNSREEHLRLGELLAWSGQTEAALREVKIYEQLMSGRTVDWRTSPARIYAALGRADDVVPLLAEELVAPPSGRWPLTPALLRIDPLWDKIRGDPRFQALCVEPPPAGKKAVAAPVAPPSPARELAAKSLALLNTLDATREDVALAEDYCQRALKLDASDGEVWAIASQVNSTFVYRGWDVTPERREQTRVMAERAIRLSPASPLAKLAQASAWATFGINPAELEKLLREVVAERPSDQAALRFLAVTVLNRGGLDECLALNERSAALPGGDPLALFNNARYLAQSGRSAEAYVMLQRSLAQKPFSGALVFKALLEITTRDDPAAAEAALQQIPPSMLLEDRANYTAGLVRFYQRRAGEAIKAWGSFPRDYYKDFAFDGPKGLLVGLADELDHRDAAAKIEWRTGLQAVEKRIAAKPNDASPYYYKSYLLACLGEKAGAGEALRTFEELAGLSYSAETPMSFEMALVYARLGRFDEIFAFPPRRRLARMELDPRFDALRSDPRYGKTLAEKQRQNAEAKK